MKKFCCTLLVVIMALTFVFAACTPADDTGKDTEQGGSQGGSQGGDNPGGQDKPDDGKPDEEETEAAYYTENLYPSEGFEDFLPEGSLSRSLSASPYKNIGSYSVDNRGEVVREDGNTFLKLSYSERGSKGYSGSFAKIDFEKYGAGRYVLEFDVRKSARFVEDLNGYKDNIGYRMQNTVHPDRQFEDNFFYLYGDLADSETLDGWKHFQREFVLYDTEGFNDFQLWYNTNFADPEVSYLCFDNISLKKYIPASSAPFAEILIGEYRQKDDNDVLFAVDVYSKPLLKVTLEGKTLASDEYSLEDTGVFTVKKQAFRSFASGYKTVTLETEGGTLDLAVKIIPRYASPSDVFRTSVYKGMSYAYYVPEDYNPDKKYPVITYMHGVGECGSDNGQLYRANEILVTLIQNPKYSGEVIIFAPQCPSYYTWASDYVSDLAVSCLNDEIIGKFSVDENRLYITGLSLGGFGTWYTIARYPEKFAAAVPVCGGIDIPYERLKNLNLPIWTFHSKLDDTVSVFGTRQLVQTLKSLGKDIIYTEYDQFTKYNGNVLYHNAWVKCYNEEETFDWMLSKVKS